LGIQNRDPAHLAFPTTVEFEIPASGLHAGKNSSGALVLPDA
jgi:hypothetical protein